MGLIRRGVSRPPMGEVREWRIKSEGSNAILGAFFVKAN